VGSREQESGYIFDLWQPIIIPDCVDLKILLVYSGGYSIVLFGDSSKCRGIKMDSGIIHNYRTDKLVTGNNHLITYLGQGILFSYHSVEVCEYWCNLEYYIVLFRDNSNCRGFAIDRDILHNY
jgi:hypothetical protein